MKNHGHIVTRFPPSSNILDTVPLGELNEFVYDIGDENEIKPLRKNHKCASLPKELLSRFTVPGDLVVDPLVVPFQLELHA